MMNRQRITTTAGPSAIGPYSQAIVAGDLVFVSGQIPLDPATGTFVQGEIEAQTRQVMRNLGGILEAAGSSLDLVVKTTVYLANLDDFEVMNKTYGTFFKGDPPARATVQVARLPKGALVEIDAIAIRKS
jgi:2-iminobutanoate/2-iminopropanoate deaminase